MLTLNRTRHLHNLPTSITIGKAQISFKQSVKNLSFALGCHLILNAPSMDPPFIAELSSVSEFSSVEEANQYCDFLRTVLDKHAPLLCGKL